MDNNLICKLPEQYQAVLDHEYYKQICKVFYNKFKPVLKLSFYSYKIRACFYFVWNACALKPFNKNNFKIPKYEVKVYNLHLNTFYIKG